MKFDSLSSLLLFLFPIALLLATVHIIETQIVVENPDEPSTFRFGQYHLRDYGNDGRSRVLDGSIKGDTDLVLSCLHSEWKSELALSLFYAAQGMSIEQALGSMSVLDEYIDLSHALNTCTTELSFDEQELLLQVSLSVFPDNVFAAKNLGFILEWCGYIGAAKEVYLAIGNRFDDLGLLLNEALGTSSLWERGQEVHIYQDIKGKLQHYMNKSFTSVPNDVLYLMRNIPLNLQYLGFPPSELYHLLSQILYNNYPTLGHSYIVSPPVHESSVSYNDLEYKIKLGVVATLNDNSSPGLCLTSLFYSIFRRGKIEYLGHVYQIEVIFFDLQESTTVFADLMHTHSKESFVLDLNEIHSSAELIAGQNLDILMYVALPTEKFTYFLAHMRLAPVQLQFGWGHPFSSGIPAVDYSIISSQMLQSQKSFRELTFRKDPFNYYEQLVAFDSQAYYINDPKTFLDENLYTDHMVQVNDTLSANSCKKTNDFFKKIGVYPNITAESIGCIASETSNVGAKIIQGTHRVYMVMQMHKKMHPAFDLVFKGILHKDPKAIFLMMDKSRSIIPRILKVIDYNNAELIYNNFVFVKRTEHHDHLKLMKLSTIFLNTFPFGAGLTSSEAYAMCLPVMILSNYSNTLPLALSQLAALGEDISKYTLAHDIQSYIDKSVSLANEQFSDDMNLRRFKSIICEKKEKIFGGRILSAVTDEFIEFFINVARRTR